MVVVMSSTASFKCMKKEDKLAMMSTSCCPKVRICQSTDYFTTWRISIRPAFLRFAILMWFSQGNLYPRVPYSILLDQHKLPYK
jgi:hypothetical protein